MINSSPFTKTLRFIWNTSKTVKLGSNRSFATASQEINSTYTMFKLHLRSNPLIKFGLNLLKNRAIHTTNYKLTGSGDNINNRDRSIDDKDSTHDHKFEKLILTRPVEHVALVELNAPKTKNAFSLESAKEIIDVFKQLDADTCVRCAILSGHGTDFTSGVDIKSFMGAYAELQEIDDIAHRAKHLKTLIEKFQAPFKQMHMFSKPIINVAHGLSLGLAMELAACSDIRYCTRDTKMAIREVLIGIAADVGSLQLMPRLAANKSLLNELIYTGRYLTIDEALTLGFVSKVFDTKDCAMAGALELAKTIASRSPVAVQGSKLNMRFSSDKSFTVGLDYNAIWNAAMMQGGDVVKAIEAILSKSDVTKYDDF